MEWPLLKLFILVALQILTILPSKLFKSKINLLLPVITLPIYISYEAYFLQPEISVNVPIRVELLPLHALIITAFILSIIRLVRIRKESKKFSGIALFFVAGSFIYWWYYILVACMFYRIF